MFKAGHKTGRKPGKTDLVGLHAACEANYLRLMRLFPEYERANIREFSIGPARVHMEVLERSPYTTFFRLQQSQGGSRWLDTVKIDVRAYHDAGMLEVGSFQSHRRIAPRYEYPNPAMYQQDEKLRQNLFLADWLEHCLQNGHSSDISTLRAAGS